MNTANPWIVTQQEYQQNEGQFVLLQPVQGLISGDQSRPFFLKSGLPPGVLAQIWQLSDLNKDGKLDRLEFSIAMRLIRNCLSGMSLPATLPDSMKQIAGAPPMPQPSAMMMNHTTLPQIPNRPTSTYGSLPATPTIGMYNTLPAGYSSTMAPVVPTSSTPFMMGIKEISDWTIPQQMKLRFSQHFNQLDRNRVGVLTGVQARGVLGESGLPTNILAQIWNMSDVNKDGCLSIEKFCIAMYLIEMVKAGYALPSSLPPELNSFCNRSKTASPQVDPSMPPPQKNIPLRTFEDKRRDNLDKGQAELERRRQILREEEDRRRAEIERKEREEAERRERERQELERRREAEREAERQIELEREKERAAEEERLKAEREEARKRLEQERIKELEKIRIRDMENQRQSEIEKTTQIQQRHKTMTFQLQALDEKSQRLNNEITEARDEIINITSEIEKMRESRDQKLARITELQTRSRQSAVQCERLSHENLQLQSDCQKTFSRTQQIENLKKLIAERNELTSSIDSEAENTKVRLATQAKLVNEKRVDFDSGKEKLQKILDTYNKLVDQFSTIKQQAEEKRRTQSITEQITETPFAIQPAQTQAQATVVKRQDSSQLYQLPPDATAFGSPETKPATSNGFESNFNADFGSAFASNGTPLYSTPPQNGSANGTGQTVAPGTGGPINATPSASGTILVKYRALFEFVARSDDELSLQPGDVILVFEGHASEPGWLAGQIKDKVGWFPASFAEPANAAPKKPATASITTSPSTEPLESIKEEPAEKEFAADFSNAFSNNKEVGKNTTQAVNKTSNGPIAAPNATATSALYDAPPGSIDEPVSATVVAKNPEPTITKSVSNSDSIRNGNGMSNVICAGTALYQWKARNDSELSFSRGDVIEVVEQAEMRWRGRLQKKPETEGWFPKSYIKVSTAESAPSKPNNAPTSQKSVESTTNTGAVATSLQSPTAETVNLAHKRNSTTSGTTEGGDWYIALYQFDALEPTDLSLRIGDRILVIEAKDEWWKGTCNGKTGIFPANYVQKASVSLAGGENMGRAVASFEATAANQISLRAGDLVRIHNTSPGGWWEGEVERDGVKHTGWFPGNYVQVLPGDNQPPSGSTKIATAAFDYDAQHADELSFKAGDVIEVADHSDNEWWRGRKQGAPAGTEPLLFPSNFVQLRTVTPSSNRANNTLPRTNHGDLSHNGVARNPSDVHATNDRLSKQTKELIDTEERFWKEMHMVRAIFKDPLSKVAGQDAIEQIFLNWDKLIELSRNIHFELKTKPAGEVFCRRIDDLEEFVRFCERQESAIEFLNGLQNKNPQFKKVYQACCQREYAKGVSLAYFLLLPMSRITRYPLIFDKMIKYSSAEDPQYETLQNTHQLLKALCARVNQALTEVENKNMLWWSQRHINCESLHSTLEFTSKTREIGPRSFLHAGILYKAKSNKLLVGLLYSDFLLLTTPIEPIVEPDTLKLTKNSDLHLQLYKTPLLMKKLMITASAEDLSFELKTADITVTLKAPNKNAKMMWTKQIEKAIEQYGVALQMKNAEEIRTYGRSSNTSNQIRIGRLVLEVVSIQDFDPKLACDGRWLTCMSGFSTSLSSDGSNDAYVWPRQKHEVDLAKNSNYFTTQMDINENMKAKDFYLALLIPMRYRPDMYIGENRIPVQELIAMSSGHPGLIMRSIRLQNGEIAASACTLNIKFFIQMFD